jgi:DNA-directed RNA polymerase specialized sigma24 family protein
MEGSERTTRKHLGHALQAANEQDERTFVLEIAASHALDGIVRGLQAKWPRVEPGAIEAIVAEAVDTLYTKVAVERAVIGSAGAFLWGTARNKLHERHRAGVLDTVPFAEGTAGLTVDPQDAEPEPDPDVLRAEALRLARALLPRLGGEVIIRVMTFIFDAIERGEAMLPNETIAAALGMTTDAVKRSKSRGWRRLEATARRDGLDIRILDDANADDADDEAGGDEDGNERDQ